MRRPNAYQVYLFLSFASGMLFAAPFTQYYETVTAGLGPLQLILVGTVLQVSRVVLEVPTGVIADVYSRRLSIVFGYTLMGLGLFVEGLFPSFMPILLAQLIWAIGYTCISGATEAWLSDEIGEERANRAFLTANRYDLSGNMLGVLAATVLGSFTSAAATILVTAAASILLAVALVFLMPEEGFKRTRPEGRCTLRQLATTFLQGLQTVRRRTVLLAILGIALFYGTTAGFDRLWVKHLTDRFDLPILFGHNELGFFGLLELTSRIPAILLIYQIEKGFDTSRPRVVGRLMLAITAGLAVAIAVFAWSPFLGLAVALYLVIYSLQELTDPLLAAWMNQRLDPGVRATLLSMIAQSQAVGQAVGGLVIGVLASVLTVPLALLVSGGLLSPAVGFILLANRHADIPHTPRVMSSPEDTP